MVASTTSSGTGCTGGDLRLGPARLEANDRLECLKDAGRHQLLADGPLEQPFDLTHALVDLRAAYPIADEALLDRLQSKRAELSGWCRRIKLANWPLGISDVRNFLGALPILAVMLFGKLPVASDQFRDRQVAGSIQRRYLSATGKPFADQTIVGNLASFWAVGTEIKILPTQTRRRPGRKYGATGTWELALTKRGMMRPSRMQLPKRYLPFCALENGPHCRTSAGS